MDHLTSSPWTMAHRAVSHPAWTTVAGGASPAAGLGHTAAKLAASLGHDALRHPGRAAIALAVLVIGYLITSRRRGGARRPEPPAPSREDRRGEMFTIFVLTAIAGAVVWLLASSHPAAQPAIHISTPRPAVTHTTIVQHITHVTKAASGIPDGMWWVAGISVVAVLVYYLARGRNHD